MHTESTLLSIRSRNENVVADVDTVCCQVCNLPHEHAVWLVTLRTTGTLFARSMVLKDLPACKHCFPLKAKDVIRLVSSHDIFLVHQQESRRTYAHLIDACRRNMPYVLGDRRLTDIYERVSTLGESLAKADLDYAWMRLNQHFNGS